MSTRDTIHDAIDADERSRASAKDAVRARWKSEILKLVAAAAGSNDSYHKDIIAAVEVWLGRVAEKDLAPAARRAAFEGYRIGTRLRKK